MPEAVCRMLTLLCTLVVACPIGTNLGLLHLPWMLASGRLLGAHGALFPGLADCGLSAPATRRAWAARLDERAVNRPLGRGPGRRRRFLARTPFPQNFPLPARLREEASATAHLPEGCWGQRRTPATPATPTTLAEAA